MLTEKEKIDQFKRELKSMHYYCAKLEELMDELYRLDRMMHEAKPQRFTQTKGNPINYLDLMQEEEKLKQEYDLLNQMKRNIEERLESLKPEDCELLIDLYVKGYSFEKVSMQKYMSVRNVKYKVDSIIKQII